VYPIFVVDRPASLRILEALADKRNEFGILAHVFVSRNFMMQFSKFPLTSLKIGDSGIFSKKEIGYQELFMRYELMGVSHGIIKDYYRDPVKTLRSAEIAYDFYRSHDYSFELIGVAQGNNAHEYLENYKAQKDLGYNIVAIGGLLTKNKNHSRMARVRNEVFMKNILKEIRKNYPNDLLFPLGIFRRSRMGFFKEIDVWASDYKGWIFRYDISEAKRKNNRFEQVRTFLRNNIFEPNKRALILSCSKSKKKFHGPAIEIYDGPAFRVVRKFLEKNDGIDIFILSAKYGLIDGSTMIKPYDLKLTATKAKELAVTIEEKLESIVTRYEDVAVFGGSVYKELLRGYGFHMFEGRIGEQLSKLKEWLFLT